MVTKTKTKTKKRKQTKKRKKQKKEEEEEEEDNGLIRFRIGSRVAVSRICLFFRFLC
jgi:hypothetical protein